MKNNYSTSILHRIDYGKNNEKSPSLKDDNDETILILGFFAGPIERLQKKYSWIGQKINKDMLAVEFPSKLMLFEKRMWFTFKKNMDWFLNQGLFNKKISLLVSSGGGTVLYLHFLRWLKENSEHQLQVGKIMWEHAPGSITPGEYYRAICKAFRIKKTIFTKMLVCLPIFIVCKAHELFSDYADRTRNAPWDSQMLPEAVCTEYAIANTRDPVLEIDYVLSWIKGTKLLGRKIHLYAFESDGHLNGHKAYPEEYFQIWNDFMNDNGK